MYIESIRFKRKKDSEWEKGYYIGETDNCENSVILDEKYQPIPKDENGYRVWDYKTNMENWIHIRC